jgi:proteasome lid subunit RPN8/RPN11
MGVKIKKTVVETILMISKSVYPKEFIGLLAGTKHKNNIIITKLIIPSGIVSGKGFASYQVHRAPYDTIGTVHSHPKKPKPSFTDLNLFSYTGFVHIITGRPYCFENMKFYTNTGDIITNIVIINGVENA